MPIKSVGRINDIINLKFQHCELDVSLADIFVASEPSTVLATVGPYHNNRKKKGCKRCGKKGHSSINCPAPAPLSLVPTPASHSSTSGNSGNSAASSYSSSTSKPGTHQIWMVNTAVTPLDSSFQQQTPF
ncbi:unnamed protein product [[Candida] boidinii]|nr:unnamed protein product [[Candida] boidinii]